MVSNHAIVAFAGRRIDDPATSSPRFPRSNIARVERDLAAFFDVRTVRAVVGSAACGADLLVLEAARLRGVRTEIVLPFGSERFRETSVIDRGANWGSRYDAAIAYANQNGRVIVIPRASGNDDDAYARATEAIFSEAHALAREGGEAPVALAVWDENPRAAGDATVQFLELAEQHGFERVEIATL